MKEFLKKITSRKFIACLLGVLTGLATSFGIQESDYAPIAGMVAAIGSVVTYIVSEAKIDAAAVKAKEEPQSVEIEQVTVNESNEI